MLHDNVFSEAFLFCISFDTLFIGIYKNQVPMKMQNKNTNYWSRLRPEHTTVGLCRSSAQAAGCGGAGQNGALTGRVAQKLKVLRACF